MSVESVYDRVEFGGLSFCYDDRVLAPRPWTAAQSRWARELLDEVPQGPVLELYSGAGHIGLLALLGNERRLVMVDSSEDACDFARLNAGAAGLLDRVEIRQGRVEEVIGAGERFPLVIADPPWVPTADVGRFPVDPVTAIDGGSDGLGPTRACLELIDRHLDPAGCCVLQVGSTAHVEGVHQWMRSHATGRLAIRETRSFGGHGVLVLLHRRTGGDPC